MWVKLYFQTMFKKENSKLKTADYYPWQGKDFVQFKQSENIHVYMQ